MMKLSKIGRLFVIKTRLEAYLVTYAIAVGAVERGVDYMLTYPGTFGLILALACTGVPFIAGAKLLDSVRPAPAQPVAQSVPATRRRLISRSRPRFGRKGFAAASPRLLRKD